MTSVTRGFILFKWFDFKDFLSVDREFPVSHQFIAVNFNPCLDKFHSALLDTAFDYLSFGYADKRFFAGWFSSTENATLNSETIFIRGLFGSFL